MAKKVVAALVKLQIPAGKANPAPPVSSDVPTANAAVPRLSASPRTAIAAVRPVSATAAVTLRVASVDHRFRPVGEAISHPTGVSGASWPAGGSTRAPPTSREQATRLAAARAVEVGGEA